MLPLSPIRLVSAANAFLTLGAEPGAAQGRMVNTFLSEIGQPPNGRWDLAFLHHVGYWSHYDFEAKRSSWPIPVSSAPEDLVLFAKQRRIDPDEPEFGDIALVSGAGKGSYARVGIVIATHGAGKFMDGKTFTSCTVLEANAGAAGRPGGADIMYVRRSLCHDRGDRYVRWVDLDARAAAGRVDLNVAIEGGRFVVRRAA